MKVYLLCYVQNLNIQGYAFDDICKVFLDEKQANKYCNQVNKQMKKDYGKEFKNSEFFIKPMKVEPRRRR